MSFEIVTSSYRLRSQTLGASATALRIGLYAGLAALYLVLVGIFGALEKKWVAEDLLPLGKALLLACFLFGGAMAAGTGAAHVRILRGALAGLVAGLTFDALFALHAVADIRRVFIVASPPLFRDLSWGLGDVGGAAIALAVATLAGAFSGLVSALPAPIRRAIWRGFLAVIIVAAFQQVLIVALGGVPVLVPLRRLLFGYDAPSAVGLAIIFLLTAGLCLTWPRFRAMLPVGATSVGTRRRTMLAAMWIVLLLMPLVVNAYYAQVLLLIGLYGLMAMGLNVELGFAGLVDLGFVAFYAIGAYTVALLTADGPIAIAHVSFWVALPIAIAMAALAGFVFGLPVLRVRGDYLAVATLSLGEIVRVLVSSDAMQGSLGGAQGIIDIAKPSLFGTTLGQSYQIYYLVLVLLALVWVLTTNLRNSYVGRAWFAVKSDEDVAQTFGIDLVGSKLLAYTIGASFAGAGGAVFAAMLGSVYPASFQLLISINVLAILVVGGLGSIPGAIIGSAALIGIPELLREFGEFRYLLTGIALILMMRLRPEGLWPASRVATRR